MTDIVKPYKGTQTGILATTEDEYAKAIATAMDMLNTRAHTQMTTAAREHVKQFSDEEFSRTFVTLLTEFMGISLQ